MVNASEASAAEAGPCGVLRLEGALLGLEARSLKLWSLVPLGGQNLLQSSSSSSPKSSLPMLCYALAKTMIATMMTMMMMMMRRRRRRRRRMMRIRSWRRITMIMETFSQPTPLCTQNLASSICFFLAISLA